MYVKELAAAIIPWWILVAILFGNMAWMQKPLLLVGIYLAVTEISFRKAKRASRAEGFKRVVRMPINRLVLRFLARGRFAIPPGTKCYTLHISTENLRNPRQFFHELAEDIRRGIQDDALYVGSTFADLGTRVNRVMGESRAEILDGELVPGQSWCVDVEQQQLSLFGRTFGMTNQNQKLILIRGGRDN